MAHKLRKIAGKHSRDVKIQKDPTRIRIVETIDIDYDCFRKSDAEKIRLKDAKRRHKRGLGTRTCRPNKLQRQRRRELLAEFKNMAS